MDYDKYLEEHKDQLEAEGYRELKHLPGRGICGVMGFVFTVVIVYGIDLYGYEGRFCYPNDKAYLMMLAYHQWDGVDDPVGPWIKHKGSHEYRNPILENQN